MKNVLLIIQFLFIGSFVFAQKVEPKKESERDHPGYEELLEFWIEENDEMVFKNMVRFYDPLTSEEIGSFSTEYRCPKDILKEGAVYVIPDTNFVFYIIIVNNQLGTTKKTVFPSGEIKVLNYTKDEITFAIHLTEPTGRVIDKTLTFQKRE